MADAIKDLAQELGAERAALKALFDSKRQPDGTLEMTAEEVGEARRRNDELAVKADRLKEKEYLRKLDEDNLKAINDGKDAVRRPLQPAQTDGTGLREGPLRPLQSLGDLFVGSDHYKAFHADIQPGSRKATQGMAWVAPDVQDAPAYEAMKAVFTEANSFAPANNRTSTVIFTAQRRPVVADLVPQVPTTLQQIRYMEETTFTNNTAPVAEGAVKPQSDIRFTQRAVTVEVIANTLPITNQTLADVPGIRGTIDNRLTLMLLLAEEDQLLNGNGATPNLQGFLTKAGIQTYAQGTAGAEPIADAVLRGMTLIRTIGFAEPSGIVMNPNDWLTVRLTRTSAGIYLWGPPSETGVERLWGLPVVQTMAMTAGTALTGDFRLYSEIDRRQDVTIDVGYVNDDFTRNQSTIRIEERLALLIYRAAAFATVTALAA